MADQPRLYAIPLTACGFDVAKVCWGTCGKGCVGGIDLDVDAAIPCTVPAAQCPHFESETSEPYGTVPDGRADIERPVYLRKLKPEAHKIRRPLSYYRKAAWRWLRWRLPVLHVTIWRHFFPLPPACRQCGESCFEHVDLPPKDESVLLDIPSHYGAQLRIIHDDIFVTVIEYACNGEPSDSLLLLESDAESMRDALDVALERMRAQLKVVQ